jgi:hypothetical protein
MKIEFIGVGATQVPASFFLQHTYCVSLGLWHMAATPLHHHFLLYPFLLISFTSSESRPHSVHVAESFLYCEV